METAHIDHGAIIAAEHNLVRSPYWPKAEKRFKLANPSSAADPRTTLGIQIHHVFAFHLGYLLGRPDTELDPRNYISLSESEKGIVLVDYHLLLGHLDDFQSFNVDIREDVITFQGQSETQIKTSDLWQHKVTNRMKPWNEWTSDDKTYWRTWLDKTYPLPNGVTPEMALANLIAGLK